MRLPQDGAHTLAGLVFASLGRKPAAGQTVSVGAVALDVDAVDGSRITSLTVHLPAGLE